MLRPDPSHRQVVLRPAVKLGVNHIDTAGFYPNRDGSVCANALIREARFPCSPDPVIATKVGPIFAPNGPPQDDLKTLGLDGLDLVTLAVPGTGSLVHLEEDMPAGSITRSPEDRPDLDTPGEELR